MRFKAFYTSIYNIRLGFIKIERKTGKKEARVKPAKKTGSPRRGIPNEGQNMVSSSRRRTDLHLGK